MSDQSECLIWSVKWHVILLLGFCGLPRRMDSLGDGHDTPTMARLFYFFGGFGECALIKSGLDIWSTCFAVTIWWCCTHLIKCEDAPRRGQRWNHGLA